MTTVRVTWEIDVEVDDLTDVTEESTPAEMAAAAINYVYEEFYGDKHCNSFTARVGGGQLFEMDLDTKDGPKLVVEEV